MYIKLTLIIIIFELFISNIQFEILAQENAPSKDVFDSINNADRIRRQEEGNNLRKLENERRRAKLGDKKKYRDEKEDKTDEKTGKCFTFDVVKITGDPFLSKKVEKKLINSIVGRCVTADDIGLVIKKISDFYINDGQITTKVFIPPQDLTKGIFEIRVNPGVIESINFSDPSMGYKSELFGAFPGIVGQRLKLNQIEYGVEQLNRIPWNQARMRLQPGSQSGLTRVIIDNEHSKMYSLAWNISNTGSSAIGEANSSLTFSLYDLFKLNDSWALTGSSSIPEAKNDYGNYSRSYSIYGSIPLGYWTFSYNRSSSEFQIHNSNSGLFKIYYTTKSLNETFTLDRVLFKNIEGKTTISATKTLRSSKQFILSDLQPGTSNYTNSFKLGLNHNHNTKIGNIDFNIGYSTGLLQTDNESLNKAELRTSPDLQFNKIESGLGYNKPFVIKGQNFNYQSNYLIQITKNILIPEEQFSVGGAYTVRGFRNQTLNADQGSNFRNEITWYLGGSYVDIEQATFWGSPSLFLAYDIGNAAANTRVPVIGFTYQTVGELQGFAFGVKSYGRSGNYSLTLSQSVKWPSQYKKEQVVNASVGINY